MKYFYYFLLLPVLIIGACQSNEPCNSVSIGEKNYLNVKIVSSSGIGGFVDNGYTEFEVVEIGKTYSAEYNGQYDQNYSSVYTSLKLPIAHNYPQTTFVLKGATVSNDTIQVNEYNARAEMTDDCGYRLNIDEPKISKFTFSVKSKPEFDSINRILTFRIQI